jgi:hypothetical protein
MLSKGMNQDVWQIAYLDFLIGMIVVILRSKGEGEY